MPAYSRPRILVSKCLGFSACRYDGKMISSPVMDALRPHVEFVTVCPECEIGLGVPREPIRMVLGAQEGKTLIQPATGLDLTGRMSGFTSDYLERLVDVDGAIFKSRSPSCGIKSAKVFASAGKRECLHRKGTGFFAEGFTGKFPYLPAVDEEELTDPVRRDKFLTGIFALASFREANGSGKMCELQDYHTRNRLLLMAHDEQVMIRMGGLVSNRENRPYGELATEYGQLLREVLSRPSGVGSNINVLMYAFGYFSERLTADEKSLFEDMLGKYRKDGAVLGVIKEMFVSWITCFDADVLLQQTYFRPYPAALSGSLPKY